MSIWATLHGDWKFSLLRWLEEINYLQWDPEFVVEAEKTRMILNPIIGATLYTIIVEACPRRRPSKKAQADSLRRKG